MVTVEQTKCNACGLCAEICHEHCMTIEEGLLKIAWEFCSTCTQCIAICPRDALSWDHVKPIKYDKTILPVSVQVEELLKSRRTIRDFKAKKIDKDLLEEVANYAVYAPTHSFDFRCVVVTKESIIRQMDSVIFKFSERLYRYLYKPKFFHTLVKVVTPKREHEYLKVKPKLEAILKRGRNFKTIPPAIILIVADKRVPLSVESAQYALHSINLYAQTKGLGCRNLVGNQMFLNRNRSIKKMIGLNKKEKIVGTMAIGYPAYKFRNKVEGKKLDVQWI